LPLSRCETPRYGTPRYRLEVPDTSLPRPCIRGAPFRGTSLEVPDTSLPDGARGVGARSRGALGAALGARHLVTEASLPECGLSRALSRCQTPRCRLVADASVGSFAAVARRPVSP